MLLIRVKQTTYYCLIMLLVLATASHIANANEQSPAAEKSIEALKADLLELNKELFILEEELFFPGNTQVAVFISHDAGLLFKMDFAKVLINNKAVNYHLYTNNELDALSRGAVHRIHTDNLNQGQHKLVIIFGGFGPKGREFKRAAELDFEKSTGSQYIELRISANIKNQQPEFQFKVWD